MFNSNILDVAVGLVFVFLLLSLICSAANELLEVFLKKRSKDLERGIQELVGAKDDSALVRAIYSHGLVNSLFRGTYDPAKKGNLPSYIPSENFALALIDLKKTASAEMSQNVKDAFRTFERMAAGDMTKLQKSVEAWYDSAMDRVSGWYKRRCQIIIFALGIVVTALVNVDAIQIAERLSTDTNLRLAAVRLAEEAAKTGPAKPEETKAGLAGIRDNLGKLDGIGLPIGWTADESGSAQGIAVAAGRHWLGWLLTAIAVSLGAPFWFDVLNKIIVVRSTVKPQEKSREEGSKDPVRAVAAREESPASGEG